MSTFYFSTLEATRTVDRPVVVAAGGSLSEGVVNVKKAKFKYHCIKITSGETTTRIAVCLAIQESDKGIKIITNTAYYRNIKRLYPSLILYH